MCVFVFLILSVLIFVLLLLIELQSHKDSTASEDSFPDPEDEDSTFRRTTSDSDILTKRNSDRDINVEGVETNLILRERESPSPRTISALANSSPRFSNNSPRLLRSAWMEDEDQSPSDKRSALGDMEAPENDRSFLMAEDPWEARLVPAQPDPNFYKSYKGELPILRGNLCRIFHRFA